MILKIKFKPKILLVGVQGGVKKMVMCLELKKTKKIAGVIIGKAIYDQAINLNDLVKII